MITKQALYQIIFKADTPAGKYFDVALLLTIGASVLVVMLDSIAAIHNQHASFLYALEFVITILFTIEYAARIYCSPNRPQYIFSFFGIIDFLAILPTYLSLLLPGAQYMAVVRIIRVLRVFRVLKYVQYVDETNTLARALYASRRKIVVFLFTVLTLITVLGSLMYVIEGPERGYTSIPNSIYWGIVTITTVGYGDISPQTPAGKVLASVIMIIGYSVIAVPTSIVSVELNRAARTPLAANATQGACPNHPATMHDPDATHCKLCGEKLV